MYKESCNSILMYKLNLSPFLQCLIPSIILFLLQNILIIYYAEYFESLRIVLDNSIINIAYCSTVSHLKNVAVSAISILNRTQSIIRFYIFTSDHFNKTHTIFDQIEKEFNHRARFIFNFISFDMVVKKLNYHRKGWNAYTFARLFMINIIPVSRCIYLDTDVFGCGDVSELWRINIGDNLIAGTADALPFKTFLTNDYLKFLNKCLDNDEIIKMNKTGLTHKNYLNAGVLLMNIDELKKIDFENKSVILWKSKKLIFVDQDLFNILAGHRRMVVDLKFNKCLFGKYSDCVLRHFNHKKVTDKEVTRHYEDYDYYFDSLDEYSRLLLKLNQTAK